MLKSHILFYKNYWDCGSINHSYGFLITKKILCRWWIIFLFLHIVLALKIHYEGAHRIETQIYLNKWFSNYFILGCFLLSKLEDSKELVSLLVLAILTIKTETKYYTMKRIQQAHINITHFLKNIQLFSKKKRKITLWGEWHFVCGSAMACRILVPQRGNELRPLALKGWGPKHWTSREFLTLF